MTVRSYHVVARSIPIVYTLEGDHDPNGMVFVPKEIDFLLAWARDRWYDNDQLLPRLHTRRQRAQLVIDGFIRLDKMLKRLSYGPDEDQDLLAELIRREQMPSYVEQKDRLSHGPRRSSHRAFAVQDNIHRCIEELRVALTDLEDLNGPTSWRKAEGPASEEENVELGATLFEEEETSPAHEGDTATTTVTEDVDPADEAPELDPATAPRPICLVTLTSEQREEWRQHWIAQAQLLDRAIEQWFTTVAADPVRRFSSVRLAARSGIEQLWVERLLLNDHAPGTNRAQPFDRFNPMKPIPFLRPLVLRCKVGETVEITVENRLSERSIGFHIQGEGLSTSAGPGVKFADGSWLGRNKRSTIQSGSKLKVFCEAAHEGVWPVNDLADVRGSELGTNAHGLFGALIVEPPACRWHDPETGEDLTDLPWAGFLDVDVRMDEEKVEDPRHHDFVDFYSDEVRRSFREFTVFFHDEPEVHSGLHTTGEHTVMPLSYRAEPMHNRLPHRMRRYVERTYGNKLPVSPDEVDRNAFDWELGDELEERFLTARTARGHFLEYVAGEEQHHSSWLFGDPVTHVQRAYAGDPCRVRLVHAGVKETHVFHLHVHQWRAVASDVALPSVNGIGADGKARHKGSQLLDSITIGPQSGMTIEPLYGSGSRQQAVGDVIWHCHLYPHFHHGMWGLWRSYNRLVTGQRPYPDGSRCPPLRPLPGRDPLPSTENQPGFPWFIDGVFPMKSPPPPVGEKVMPGGRRLLLRMPNASKLELNAMPSACRNGSQPGATFVDLDNKAAAWNAAAGLPPPRIISYDVEVLATPTKYNVDGWHDPRCHHYRLLSVDIREQGTNGEYKSTIHHRIPVDPVENPVPFFPRANHGDIVEWRHLNSLSAFPADAFDHGQLPVECGLHVHLVKFDPLAADGSSTGWNYLSGASCRSAVAGDGPGEQRTVSLHRWVVDEEFGPCFFHDHLLANFRQKHGLFAALIAEPHGSDWLRADDQSETAFGQSEAVIVPPKDSGLPPFREACLAIGDFVPLLDQGSRPLNPPSTLSGDDDPGTMAVNYRCAPLIFRGPDPSLWFSSSARSRKNFAGERGDPDTPVIRTYPGERMRLRLIQGSHEEQHGFTTHGLRWRRDWGNARSRLVNQQTIGISEAFTLDIDPKDASPYSVGDHLWHFSAADDIWLGCWGFVRSLPPISRNFDMFSPLPDYIDQPREARERFQKNHFLPDIATPRTFVVVAQRTEHEFTGKSLTDPWGLIYRSVPFKQVDLENAIDTDRWIPPMNLEKREPLVLRARRGEWIRLILINDIIESDKDPADGEDGTIEFGVEPSPPRLPLEHLDELMRPDRRTVSSRVSIHPSLLLYDVGKFDGSYAGRNHDSTIGSLHRGGGHVGVHMAEAEIPGAVVHRTDHDRRNWREYWWFADEHLAPASYQDGPGQVCFLHDMADIRNHRHHGLIGALVVEPGDVTPFVPGKPIEAWTGVEAEMRNGSGQRVAHEAVMFFQDGLRHFVNGHPDFPVPDVDPTDDPEDSGQKAVNYRSHPVHRGVVAREGSEPSPPQPLATLSSPCNLWLRVLGGNEKPRQHTLTVHGCAWPEASWDPKSPLTGALSGIAPCFATTLTLKLPFPGDYAARTGAFRWGSEHGVWTNIKVL